MISAQTETRLSKQIGALMGQGKKEEAEEVKKQVTSQLSDHLAELEEKEKDLEEAHQKDHDDDPEHHRSVRTDR